MGKSSIKQSDVKIPKTPHVPSGVFPNPPKTPGKKRGIYRVSAPSVNNTSSLVGRRHLKVLGNASALLRKVTRALDTRAASRGIIADNGGTGHLASTTEAGVVRVLAIRIVVAAAVGAVGHARTHVGAVRSAGCAV